MVDGQPAEFLSVKLIPLAEVPSDIPPSAAFTEKNGRFSIGTFESGDGAPPGSYKMTFLWGQYDLLNGRYGGPDKLNGRYEDPQKSSFEVTVSDKHVNLGTIELSTKD